MSEGPQTRLRGEWLHRHLAGREVVDALTSRDALRAGCEAVRGRLVREVTCRGKHIFLCFSGGMVLHNHLLMRGRWRKVAGQFLFLPPGMWMGLSVGAYTVCNVAGQVLEWLDADGKLRVMAGLGPDLLAGAPREAWCGALPASALPVAEALLDQSVVSGLGNVARCEALFLAGLSPALPARSLRGAALTALWEAACRVMRESYAAGGRWVHRVYQRAGQPCPTCGTTVRVARLAPSRRAVYYCPACQRA